MRNSHQKSRSRGRNRKPQNPLSRNYESNGPDVKIRGNAGHIAEKYASLARDALSNGDTVMAENYLQHAEHYNRIVATAQAQRAEEQLANEKAQAAQQQNEEKTSEGDAGVSADGETSNETQGEESQAKPRRNGRGRKPRAAAEANDNAQEHVANGESGAAKNVADTSAEAVAVETISEDAAKLPENLTAGFLSDDA